MAPPARRPRGRPPTRAPLRREVFLVALDPTRGSEIQKTRPCVVVSPDDVNAELRTVQIVPLTSGSRPASFRVDCTFAGKPGRVLLDQLRTVDRVRLIKRLGVLEEATMTRVLDGLVDLFTP